MTCPIKEVMFLRDRHRHIFHIKMSKEVNHSDRDIEIILFKREVQEYLKQKFGEPCEFGSMSCEMIAEHLLQQFNANEVEVLEDNENGANVKTSN